MATQDEQQPERGEDRPSPPREVRAYRTPRYPVFLLTGAVLGLLVGVGLAWLGGPDRAPSTSAGGALGYLAFFGALLGALAAGTLAVVVESLLNRGRRRSR